MLESVKQPPERRGEPGATLADRGDRRSRIAVVLLGAFSALFFAAALAMATDVGSLFRAGTRPAAAPGLPPGWRSLDPLLPLTPDLNGMGGLKGAAARGGRTLAGRRGGAGELRIAPRPGAAHSTAPVTSRTPASTRPVSTAASGGLGSPLPTVAYVVFPVAQTLPGLGDLLGAGGLPTPNLPALPGLPTLPSFNPFPGGLRLPPVNPFPAGLPIPSVSPLPGGLTVPPVNPLPGGVTVPPVNSTPGGVSVPGVRLPGSGVSLPTVAPATGGGVPVPALTPLPGGVSALAVDAPTARPPAPTTTSMPLSVTVTEPTGERSLDVLTVSLGSVPVERYVYPPGDITGLATQINLRSRLLVADALGDGVPLASVEAAPVGDATVPAAAALAVPPGTRWSPGAPAGGGAAIAGQVAAARAPAARSTRGQPPGRSAEADRARAAAAAQGARPAAAPRPSPGPRARGGGSGPAARRGGVHSRGRPHAASTRSHPPRPKGRDHGPSARADAAGPRKRSSKAMRGGGDGSG